MTNLQTEALKLVLKLDELIEPLEDCDSCSNPERLRKLKGTIKRASIRYYRRREIVQPSSFSLVEMIIRKNEQCPTVHKNELEYVYEPDGQVAWELDKINPKMVNGFMDGPWI